MCRFEVDLAEVADRHGCAVASLSASLTRLGPFIIDGLLVRHGLRLRVTEEGRLLVRSICACFDAYFEPEATRHSKAL